MRTTPEADRDRQVAADAVGARSADAALLDRLPAAGWQGRVHSVFTRTINIETAAGTLVTLAADGCDDAPDSVVLDLPDFTGSGVLAGDPVTAMPARIAIAGRLTVDLRAAARWQEDLPRGIDPQCLRANLPSAQVLLSAAGTAGGMLAAGATADAWTGEVTRALAIGTAQVRLSLLRGDDSAFRAHAASLIGLGPGLTPSGDDFLVGLFAALRCGDGAARFARPCADIVAAGASRTNAISLAALRHAAAGRVRASIAQLLQQLCQGSPDTVAPALQRVLAIGSTSGTDIAAGVVCGAGIHLERPALEPGFPSRVPAARARAAAHGLS